MSTNYNPQIVTDGLILLLDAGNKRSYSGTGTTWTDLGANGYNATVNSGVSYNSANLGSFLVNSTDDDITLGNPPLLRGVQVPLTITGFAKLDNISGLKTLYSAYKLAASNQIYSLIRIDSGVLRYYSSTSDGGFQGQGTLTPEIGKWNFYCVVVSGTLSSPVVKIYLNSTSESFSYSAFSSNPDLSVIFKIGKSESPWASNEHWIGNIATISVYNRALTEDEVKQNFNALRGRYGI